MEGVLDALSEHLEIDSVIAMVNSEMISKERGYELLSSKNENMYFLKKQINILKTKIQDKLLEDGKHVVNYRGEIKVSEYFLSLDIGHDNLSELQTDTEIMLNDTKIEEIGTLYRGNNDKKNIYAGKERLGNIADIYYFTINADTDNEKKIYMTEKPNTFSDKGCVFQISVAYIK